MPTRYSVFALNAALLPIVVALATFLSVNVPLLLRYKPPMVALALSRICTNRALAGKLLARM